MKIYKNPKFVFPFFMALFMITLMSCLMTFLNLGFCENFFIIWMKNLARGFCVGFPAVLIVSPIVGKIVKKVCG